MPIDQIGDLNIDRHLGDDFDLRISSRMGPDGNAVYSVRVSCAQYAGERVIENYGSVDITNRLPAAGVQKAVEVLEDARAWVKNRLGL